MRRAMFWFEQDYVDFSHGLLNTKVELRLRQFGRIVGVTFAQLARLGAGRLDHTATNRDNANLSRRTGNLLVFDKGNDG